MEVKQEIISTGEYNVNGKLDQCRAAVIDVEVLNEHHHSSAELEKINSLIAPNEDKGEGEKEYLEKGHIFNSIDAKSIIKDKDGNKAVTFAEDAEIYDLNSKVATMIPVNKDDDDDEVELEDYEPVMVNGSVYAGINDGGSPSTNDISADATDRKAKPNPPSAADEIHIAIIDVENVGQHTQSSKDQPTEEQKESSTSTTPFDEGTPHKGPIVSAVEEPAQLGLLDGELDQDEKLVLVLENSLSSSSDVKSNGFDGSNQVTIFPLENLSYKAGSLEDSSEGATGSPDSDENKKDSEGNKAVTFAEDVEIYDPSSKVATLIPVNIDDEGKQEDIKPGSDHVFVDCNALDESPSTNVTSSETIGVEEKHIPPLRPSAISLSKDVPAVDEIHSAVIEVENIGKQTESPEDQPSQVEKEEHTVVVAPFSEGTPHREFTVSAVEEPTQQELQDGESRQEEKLVLVLEDRLGSSSDFQFNGYEGNNQDTIGPLENPAFLKTLNYTVSQAFDDDEHLGLHSNIDIRSLADQTPPDLDGGWAWVILFGCFIGQIIIGATVYMAGILVNEVVETLDPDLSSASWIGSANVATMCISGPFVGIVLKRLGSRVTMMIASFVATTGFFLSSFASSTTHLIITHGLIAGVGAGFVINPMFVVTGQYFNRYRGVACGLLATGAGAGMLTGGPIITLLIQTYRLPGAYMIWAGVVSHIAIIGMLMRPSPEERLRKMENDLFIGESRSQLLSQHDLHSGHNSMMSGLNSWFGSVNHSMMSGMDKISHGKRSLISQRNIQGKIINGELEMPLLRSVLHKEISRSSYSVFTNRSHHRSHLTSPSQPMIAGGRQLSPNTHQPSDPIHLLSIQGTSLSPTDTVMLHSPSVALASQSQHALSQNLVSNNSPHFMSASTLATPSVNTPYLQPSTPTSAHGASLSLLSRPPRSRLWSTGSRSQFTSTSHISRHFSHSHAGEFDNESLSSAMVSQLHPYEAIAPRHILGSRSISTLMGSVASFPMALAMVKDDLSRVEAFSARDSQGTSIKGIAITCLDNLRLLKKKPFLVFLFANFMWAFGESPLYLYLPSYAISQGTSKMQASFLFTTMGIGSMTGRFLSGLVSGDKDVGPLIIFAGSLGVSGMLVVFSPLCMNTVSQQMFFSTIVGIYLGALVPLTSLITIDLLGISELGLGFGFLSMTQGIGYLIGPPLAGVIASKSGYSQSFVYSGFTLMAASMVTFSVSFFLTKADDEDDDDQMHELEQALQHIEDNNSDAHPEDYIEDDPGAENTSLAAVSIRSRQNSIIRHDETKKFTVKEVAPEEPSPVEPVAEVTVQVQENEEDRLEPIQEEAVK